MKRSLIVVAVLMSVALVAVGETPEDPFLEALETGRDVLNKGLLDEAETAFRQALDLAERAEPNSVYQASFFLGLTKQKKADATKAPESRHKLLVEAKALYERALTIKPESVSVLFNVGQVDRGLGDLDAAEVVLKRGLELDRNRNRQFAELLGDIYVDRWSSERLPIQTRAAVKYYRMALETRNPSAALRDKYLINVLIAWSEGDPDDASRYQDEMASYLWVDLKEGNIDRAMAGALRVLEAGIGRNGGDAEMLTIIAAGLAKKEYDAVGFVKSNTFFALQALAANEDVDLLLRQRITSLIALYQGLIERPEDLAAWKIPELATRTREQPSGLESVRQIARALGYAAQRDKVFPKAEQLYTLALRLDETSLDPATLRDLATIYYAQQKLPQLEQLLRQFEQGLYDAKSAAYDRVDWEQVYEYHHTLGSMYQWLDRNEDAKAQFDHALKVAQLREGSIVDPALRLQRAEVYEALGQRGEAAHEWLDAAESYARAGDLIRVRSAASHIAPGDLANDEGNKRFDTVLDVAVIVAEPPAIENLQGVKQAITVLTSNPDKLRRVAAEKQLEQWGVTNVRVELHGGTFSFAKQVIAFSVPDEAAK
jgi:tetratricopeptide (TPR) repeat protein